LAHSHEAETVSRWRMRLDDLKLALRADRVLVGAVSCWGPFRVTWEVGGVPRLTDGHWALAAVSARLGHLELPRALAAWLAAPVADLFNRWPADREVLAQLGAVVVEAGRVTLTTRTAEQQR